MASRDAGPSVSFLLSALLGLLQAAAPPPAQNASPSQPTAQNASPAVVTPPADPGAAYFTADVGILLVAIKPAAIGDYETVIQTVQEALAKDTDPGRVAAAKGWHVFKAAENDAKGNALYIHVMQPAVQGFDYRLSLLLDELIKDLAPELLVRYQEAFAVPSTRLNLTEFANMSMAPVPPPESLAEKPPGKKPGG